MQVANPDTAITATPDLTAYTAQINTLHRRIHEDILKIADLLTEAKAQVGRGKWILWIESGVLNFGSDTAERFVNAAAAYRLHPELSALGHTIAAKLAHADDAVIGQVISLIDAKTPPTGDQVTVMLRMRRDVAQMMDKHHVTSIETAGLVERLPAEVIEEIHASGYVQNLGDGDEIAITDDPRKIMQALTARRKTEVGIIVDAKEGLNLRVSWIEGYGWCVAGYPSQEQAELWVLGKGR